MAEKPAALPVPNVDAIPDDRTRTPLLDACYACDVKRIKELLQRGADPRAQDRWSGDTALHLLCGRGSLNCPPEELEELIRLFISRGVNPDEQDRDNNSPLHPAAYADNVVAARALLAAGASPSKWDSDYQTPRDRAEYFNHTAVATLLKEAEEKRRTAT